jgi:P-type Cu+ transporter
MQARRAHLEVLAQVDTLVVDKTGTLTEGAPRLTDIVSDDEDDAMLALAAALEAHSEHPLARAFLAAAADRGLAVGEAAETRAVSGAGISGRVDGHSISLGNLAFLEDGAVESPIGPAWTARSEALSRAAKTVVAMAVDGRIRALFAISDPLKDGAAGHLAELRAEGLTLIMMSGDNEATARAVADELGIEQVHAPVSPADKARLVDELQSRSHRVAMAGDGINDAPALSTASVGIAMGNGSDIAVESAGITLLRGELGALLRARRLATATARNIRQNLVWAFLYNTVGVPVAAGVLYPVAGILLSPMIAAAAMSLSSVSVIVNALRLRAVRLD